MGQFSHPNVVKLYGVVTVGEPVRLAMNKFCEVVVFYLILFRLCMYATEIKYKHNNIQYTVTCSALYQTGHDC